MNTSEFLRNKARECRELMACATAAEVGEQLEVWAREFEAAAAGAEKTVGAVLVITAPTSTQGN